MTDEQFRYLVKIVRQRAAEENVAVQKEPKCIFFNQMNPVADIFKIANKMDDNQ